MRQVQTNIRSIGGTVQSNSREIQDITKLIDVRKAEIRSELTESFNQSRDRLDFQIYYANIKYKLFSFFAHKHDRDYHVKQLEGITRNNGELLQDFCNRVSL